MKTTKYIAVSGYTDHFKLPLPEDSLRFLREYPADLILLRLSKINAMLFQERDGQNMDLVILKDVIFENVLDRKRFEEIASDYHGVSRLFAAPPLTTLMTNCLQNYVQGSLYLIINTLEFARNLFRTLLIYNQLYYGRFDGKNFESLEAVFKLEVMQQSYLRRGDPLNMVTSMKFAFISKFVNEHQSLKSPAQKYFKKIGLGNPWLFNKFFMEVLTTVTWSANQGKHILELESMPVGLIREFEFKLADLDTKDKLSLHMDVIPKPFYLIDEQQAIILDYSFFQYAMEHGFFYSFYQRVLTQDSRFKNFGVFKSYIGMHFFEKYLVGGYLNAIFQNHGQLVIATEKYQDFLVKSSARDIFLIEVKMTDLNPRTLENLDYQEFKTYLDNNFLSSKEKGGKNKGVAQLIRQIEHLAAEDSELRDMLAVKSAKRLNIYPIIICSDVNVNIGGVHEYVNAAFDDIIGPRRENFESIQPLIILHVDLLIEHFGLLKRTPGILSEWIKGYVKQNKNLMKQFQNDGGIDNYLKTKRSFASFLAAKDHGDLLSITLKEMESSFKLNVEAYGGESENSCPIE